MLAPLAALNSTLELQKTRVQGEQARAASAHAANLSVTTAAREALEMSNAAHYDVIGNHTADVASRLGSATSEANDSLTTLAANVSQSHARVNADYARVGAQHTAQTAVSQAVLAGEMAAFQVRALLTPPSRSGGAAGLWGSYRGGNPLYPVSWAGRIADIPLPSPRIACGRSGYGLWISRESVGRRRTLRSARRWPACWPRLESRGSCLTASRHLIQVGDKELGVAWRLQLRGTIVVWDPVALVSALLLYLALATARV